ncbi:EVE domain-containing protein [Rhodotorula paludigena]|uniref:EVE domain-containing protein n=1 Tax=Rhodotorula paludigena TaxID=86838 RepID=UPI0031797E0A
MAPRARAGQGSEGATYSHWLIKAEPESRIEKGVDVKFSIDDLEDKRTTTWEGVRNHEAKKYLRDQMKLGHECLFYASNCKVPGVSGLAKVIKEGYPDYNAFDAKHPYYDAKSKKDDPTWYMVDVEFLAKFEHLVPLSLLQHLASLAPSSSTTSSTPALPASLAYLTPSHLSAIAGSALIRRGRLSVQPVEREFFEAVKLLGERGGWEDCEGYGKGGKKAAGGKAKGSGKGKRVKEEAEEEEEEREEEEKREGEETTEKGKGKAKAKSASAGTRSSGRKKVKVDDE